ncbi:MAG: LacI family DNA-binding transcriptional regulator [Spirochaetales bacterium]|nr:LacI family DNA-binding transcriptional regulator [Spirochaetales bacterium]
MEKVTIKDIARVANVSYATVSRALSGSSEIGEATRERILKICNEMNYIPDSVARSMVKKHTNILGVVTASINNPFMSELIEAIEITAREKGYNLMVCNSAYDLDLEKRQFSLLLGRRVDGIIVIPAGQESACNLSAFQTNIPVVYVSENLTDTDQSFVAIDNAAGAKLGVEYLNSLGHKKILYLGRREGSLTHTLRSEGVLNACNELGMDVVFKDNEAQGKSSMDAGYRLAKEYFRDPCGCTAIFCATDSLALGTMQAADELGLKIPEYISLLGFDNISFTGLPRIGITTVEQPKTEMAQAAFELVTRELEEGEARPSVSIAPRLVIRTSCRPLMA